MTLETQIRRTGSNVSNASSYRSTPSPVSRKGSRSSFGKRGSSYSMLQRTMSSRLSQDLAELTASADYHHRGSPVNSMSNYNITSTNVSPGQSTSTPSPAPETNVELQKEERVVMTNYGVDDVPSDFTENSQRVGQVHCELHCVREAIVVADARSCLMV